MPRAFRLVLATLPAAALLLLATTTSAQLPDPPSTVYGSITDAAGAVPAGIKIEAYVNNTLCGESETVQTGEGDARVTVYVVDVISDDQQEGCGLPGEPVRIKVGDRLSQRAVAWESGLVALHITFGENVTPKPIPTFTPTPIPTGTPTGAATSTDGQSQGTRTPGGQGGGPGISATPGNDQTPGSRTPGGDDEGNGDGVTSSTPSPPSTGSDDGGGGFPTWGVVLLALLGAGAVAGGAGYVFFVRTNEEGTAV